MGSVPTEHWDPHAHLQLQAPCTEMCRDREVRETKPSILTRGRAPTKLLSVAHREAPDNCLPPGLKKLLFPVRAEQTAQWAHGVTPSTAWVCVLLVLRGTAPAWQLFVVLPSLPHRISQVIMKNTGF